MSDQKLGDHHPQVVLAAAGLDEAQVAKIVGDALTGADDGELFAEYGQSETLMFDNGRLKVANFDTSRGMGLRAIAGEKAGYAHTTDMSEAAIRRLGDAVGIVTKGHEGTWADAPMRTNTRLYGDENPIQMPQFAEKSELLQNIDAYARSRDSRVSQVTASLSASWKVVEIVRPDGAIYRDVRPLVRFHVSVVAEQDGRREQGSYGTGGRQPFAEFITTENWQAAVDEAIRQANVNLEAIPAPAGEIDVVLGAGWPGILLHEAVGHGLEGDFNRRGESAFAGLMGEMVASEGVTVVDDGTIAGRRGSLSIDDEGTPTQNTVLIENGRLVGYMQDRQNGRLMGGASSGNGRRQSYAHIPMPRMTNTYMLNGSYDPGEILASVDRGLYAVSFGGGQVDITSGKFVFECTEAYMVENGKIGAPVKGAMIIGNGPDALTRVPMVGNDMKLDPGIGTCGKNGQGVPVGVGQPTLRINRITVGGTQDAA
ncbi:MAG: metalloprotease TldD [Pseudomonadota bacterium]